MSDHDRNFLCPLLCDDPTHLDPPPPRCDCDQRRGVHDGRCVECGRPA